MFYAGFPFEQNSFQQNQFDQDEHQGVDGENVEPIDNEEFYQIFGLDKNATSDQIRKAYRQIIVKIHPDKGGDPEMFRLVQYAYDVLYKEETKKIYDRYGKKGLQQRAGMDPFFFGQNQQSKYKKTKAIIQKLSVTLEDIYIGKMVNLKINKHKICEDCNGQGGQNVKICDICQGQKYIIKQIEIGPEIYAKQRLDCDKCKMKGIIISKEDTCQMCNGAQVIQIEKEIEIVIEKGIPDKHNYDLIGIGDEFPGVNTGDLIVQINVDLHDKFIRKGVDLYYNQTISLKEALVGCYFQIKHLDDEHLFIQTRQGEIIRPNQLKMIKGKGMPTYKDSMNYGNLFISFNIEFPPSDSLSQEQISHLKQILPGPIKSNLPECVQVLEMEEFDIYQTEKYAQGINDDSNEDTRYQEEQNIQCAQQ